MKKRSGCSRCRAISRRTARRWSAPAPSRSTFATREQLDGLDGLIIPGGESTTMLKLLRYEDLIEPLREFGRRKPIFGTCAGAILLAERGVQPGAGEPRADGYRGRAQRLRPADRQPRRRARAGCRISSSAPRPGNWKRSSSARPSSGASATDAKVLARYQAIRCWWSRASIWSRRSTRN